MKDKLAIFDLDGTLFATEEINYHAYAQAMDELGYQLEYSHFVNHCNGRYYKEFLSPLVNSPEDMEEIHDRKKEYYSKYLHYARKNNHLFWLIEDMHTYYTAIATTASRQNTFELLENFKCVHLFDKIVTRDDVTHSKPDPECFLLVMREWNLSPDRTLIFEDSDIGIQAARQTGATVLCVSQF